MGHCTGACRPNVAGRLWIAPRARPRWQTEIISRVHSVVFNAVETLKWTRGFRSVQSNVWTPWFHLGHTPLKSSCDSMQDLTVSQLESSIKLVIVVNIFFIKLLIRNELMPGMSHYPFLLSFLPPSRLWWSQLYWTASQGRPHSLWSTVTM